MTLTHTDFYKLSHHRFMGDGITQIYSNMTARSAKHAPVLKEFYDDKVVFFGLQYLIRNYLKEEWDDKFFHTPKETAISYLKRRVETSLGYDAVSMSHFEELHDLGYLPILIKALPEGSRVNIGVPMFTITNTHDDFAWLTNYLETIISCELWKPITTATIAFEYRRLLTHYANLTGASTDLVGIQGHDFSFRGMPGRHDAAISGMGHLLSFVGTDTIPAIDLAEDYYFADSERELIACSVPASEHSVTSLGSAIDGEFETIKRWITEDYPTGIVSIVSDTYDYWKVLTEYLPRLKDDILARQPNDLGLNKVVVRPDSGDPADIICGDAIRTYQSVDNMKDYILDDVWEEAREACEGSHNMGLDIYSKLGIVDGQAYRVTIEVEYNRYDKQYYYVETVQHVSTLEEVLTPEQKGSIELLWDTFGGTINAEGYKELDPHIGLIYGDSITLERAQDILERLKSKGFASTNVVFGIGSYTYQYLTRDTFGMAIKATAARKADGELVELFKDPVTDDGTKKSAKGLLRVERTNGNFVLRDQQSEAMERMGELCPIFEDGHLLIRDTLENIRNRLEREL